MTHCILALHWHVAHEQILTMDLKPKMGEIFFFLKERNTVHFLGMKF